MAGGDVSFALDDVVSRTRIREKGDRLTHRVKLVERHQHGGRFVTLIPRTRSEDGAFRASLASGQVRWRPVHERRDDEGNIVDRFSASEAPTLSAEGYRLVWYHSTRKAENDAAMRARQVDRALRELAELQQKLGSPRSRSQERAKVVTAVETILESRGAGGWITTTIDERVELPITMQWHDGDHFRVRTDQRAIQVVAHATSGAADDEAGAYRDVA